MQFNLPNEHLIDSLFKSPPKAILSNHTTVVNTDEETLLPVDALKLLNEIENNAENDSEEEIHLLRNALVNAAQLLPITQVKSCLANILSNTQIYKITERYSQSCHRCGSHLRIDGYCVDTTCPFSEYPQDVNIDELSGMTLEQYNKKHHTYHSKRVPVLCFIRPNDDNDDNDWQEFDASAYFFKLKQYGDLFHTIKALHSYFFTDCGSAFNLALLSATQYDGENISKLLENAEGCTINVDETTFSEWIKSQTGINVVDYILGGVSVSSTSINIEELEKKNWTLLDVNDECMVLNYEADFLSAEQTGTDTHSFIAQIHLDKHEGAHLLLGVNLGDGFKNMLEMPLNAQPIDSHFSDKLDEIYANGSDLELYRLYSEHRDEHLNILHALHWASVALLGY